jgi:hypothetical protein
MDDEFPKTLNAAVDAAGKVHGSIRDLVVLLTQLDEHLGGLTASMTMVLPAMKAAPPVPVLSKPASAPAHIATSTPEK